jgi:PAS domain S-box-containing protein
MISANAALSGTYDHGEVARSVLIAIAASYAALDLAGRVTAARGLVRLAWLGGGAVAMGIGIWTMHLKGMLAFHLPVPVEYHWPTVLAGLLVAIFAFAVALYVTSRHTMNRCEALTGSIVMGAGIAGLHYILMAAMRMPATLQYAPVLVACSILLAVVFSLIALLMAFGLREETRWSVPRRVGSAVVMGAAISAMHYTGMAAANFIPGPVPDLRHAVSITPIGGSGVVIATLIVLMATMVTSSVDRRARAEIERLNEELERRVTERTIQLETVNQSLRKEIAERELADAEVRESEARFRLVADSAPVMIWMSATDKLCTYFNKPWLDFTGRPLDRELGNGWTEGVHPEDLPRCLDTYVQSFDRREAFRMEYRLRRHDGEFRWILDLGVPRFNPDGSFAGYIGSCIDVTERRRAEEQLHQAREDLARVTRVVAMGELAAAIAHEVNQPLTAIITNGSFSLRQLESATPNSDELRAAIREIVNDGTRASAVISRIRGLLMKSAPRRAELDINQIVQDATALLQNELTRNRVSLRSDLAANLQRVAGDAVQLQQVLINLVMNAIEAMRTSTDGKREIVVRSATKPDGVLVQVEDSGPGMEPEVAGHIFEPFFTTKADGIGMGLAISHSIIESHGGRLSLVRASQGALFQFTLPSIPAVPYD